MVRFVLPVKRLRAAKSRLDLPPVWRVALAGAMFADTLDAVLATDLGVAVVVSPDEEVLDRARDAGAVPVAHHGGLNEAVVAAVGPGACAAVLPDLPALRSGELRGLLAAHPEGAVRDHTGSGTTVLFGPRLRPAFGPGSAARHASLGACLITMPVCGLTVDVDTLEDLALAGRIGLGRRTADLYAKLGADPDVPIDPESRTSG